MPGVGKVQMAILKSGELSFDFRYGGFGNGWVQYQFYFRWKEKTVIKDESLKRRGDYWGSRPEGAFLANEDESDSFVPFLRKVLETDEADYWEPTDPDIIVALYPGDYFPFLKSHYKVVFESDDLKQQRRDWRKLKEEKRKLPDDHYTFIVFVDAYNFKDADAYYGEGFSMHMVVERQDLEAFTDELEREYASFKGNLKG